MIKGLGTSNFVSTTVSTSTKPQPEAARPQQAAGRVSNVNDSFEQANAAAAVHVGIRDRGRYIAFLPVP
jgi:hypothetical protein